MKQFFTLFLTFLFSHASAQVFWNEDFNDAAATTRWVTENAMGSKTNPTPAGITGLTYSNNDACNNYWIINDFNTPENSPAGVMGIGVNGNYTTRFVRGRNYNCLTPNDLPNPDPGGGVTNKSLHITFKPCSDSYSFGLNNGPADGADEYSILNSEGPTSPGASNSEQYVYLNQDINTVGRCNIYLEAQMFLGGDQAGAHSHGTVLYSINSGATWKVLQDNIVPSAFFIAGTCNNWEDRSFLLPAECEGITTLRFAFRWRNDGNQPPINTTADYTLMAGFNVDNVVLKTVGPTVDFDFGQMGSTRIVSWTGCKMENVTTLRNITSGSGITAYSWNIPGATYINSTTSSSFEPDFLFDNAQAFGTKTITLAVTYGNGCTAQFSRDVTLAPCTPFLDFTAKYTTICATVPAPVSGAVTIDTLINNTLSLPVRGAVTYTWTISGPGAVTFVNSTNANSVTPQVTFGAVGQYTVQLVASNMDGAGSNSPLIKTNYINVVNCQCGNAAASGTSVSYNFSANNNFLGWTTTNVGGGSNAWYVRDLESARPPNTCGASGAGDHSLFYGFVIFGIGGAAFLDNCNFVTATPTAMSPNISTIGLTNIVLQFDFIGDGGSSYATCDFSTDGGTTWTTPTPNTYTTTPAVPVGSNMGNLLTNQAGCGGQGRWTRATYNMPSICEGINGLKIRFSFVNLNDCGGVDPSFAVDKIIVSGSTAVGTHTWLGTTADWHTASNWSTGTVPNSSSSIIIPDAATLGAGKFMPEITSANAFALNVCNNGTITIGNGATNRNLRIGGFLNNYGAITTTNSNSAPDVTLNGTASIYRGGGLNHDVDYQIGLFTTESTTLESNLSCRSLTLNAGTLVASNNTITLKKDFTRAAGTTLTTTATTNFVFDGPNAASWTNPYSNPVNQVVTTQDVTTAQNITLGVNTTFPNVYIRKQNDANIATLASGFTYTVSNLLQIESGTLDANTRTLNGAANVIMTGGQLRTSKLATTLPEITGTYTLTAGTIDFYGAGAQTVKQLPAGASTAYYNMIFQGSGLKTFVAGTTTCNNSVNIAGTAIVDVTTNTFNGNASLTMAATACSLRVAKVAGTPTLPELAGNYSLANPSVIEIQNTTAGTQTQYLRVPTGGNYANLLFTNTGAASTVLRYLTGNTTVNNSVVLTNASGANNVVDALTYTFDGNASLSMSNFSNLRLAKTGVSLPEFTGTITYNDGTNVLNSPGVEFYGSGSQTFKTNAGYRNMLFSNTGTKTMQSGTATATRSVNITGGLVVVAGATDQFNGAAELRMSGGELQIATLQATAMVPQFTGVYTLNAGRVTLNGAGNQTLRSSVSVPAANYIELNFAGNGVKSLTGNTNVFGRLFLNLPTTAGNYVDALTTGSVLNVSNTSLSAVYRSGGHVVGDLRRSILSIGFPLRYFYPVGSDGLTGTVTYYEPLQMTLNSILTGTASVTSNFSKTAPSTTWSPPITELGINYNTLETEGFWNLSPSPAPTGAIDYGVEVTPSAGWIYSFTNKALVKRTVGGISPADEWNWHNSNRITEFSRDNYDSFSEFAIVTADNVLPVVSSPLTAFAKNNDHILVQWNSYSEVNHQAYILERSDFEDFRTFEKLYVYQNNQGNNQGNSYQHADFHVEREKMYYYRYRQIDIDGKENFSNIASAQLTDNQQEVIIYPNPSQSDVHIVLKGFDEDAYLIIYDVLGKKMFEQHISAIDSKIQIPSSQWSSGVYHYQIQSKNLIKGKFIIQK